MSDRELVTLRAQLDAANQRILDLESGHDTIPCKPLEDTGPISAHDVIKAQAALYLQDTFQQLEETQKTLEVARFKTDQALGLAATDEAKRVPTRMERIEEKLDALAETVQRLADGLLEDHQAVISLRAWRQRHERENHCDNCDFRTTEAQEG
jgi:hypothetical protein